MTNEALEVQPKDTRPDPSTIGGRIRMMRDAKGWSQETLASKVHVTQPAVAQWENNHWCPSRQSQFLLAEALGTTRYWLFGEKAA